MGLLAEQIVIDCAPSRLENLFGHPSADWMTPLLRLAGDEGDAAGLAVLGERGHGDRRQAPRRHGHQVDVGRATPGGGPFRTSLRWRATGYRALFVTFEGTLEVRALGDSSVVSVQGSFSGPEGPAPCGAAVVASRRAAECALRSLLGHVRTAVERSAFSPG